MVKGGPKWAQVKLVPLKRLNHLSRVYTTRTENSNREMFDFKS